MDKSARFNLRLTDKQLKELRKRARQKGESMSELIRRLLEEEKVAGTNYDRDRPF
jgi:predicted DNA binding CopG/RHH family protein